MTDSVALRAIYAMRTRLQAIDGNSPFNTAAGGTVLINRSVVEKGDLPLIVIVPGDETVEPSSGGGVADGRSQAVKVQFDVNVEGMVLAEQSNTGEQLEEIKADIKRALMLFDEPTLKDGLFSIGPIGYLGSTPLPREDGAATESVQCRFRVTYTEKFGDPNATR